MYYIIKNINDFSENEIDSFVNRIKEPKRTKLSKLNKKSFKQSVIGEMLLENLLRKKNINYVDVNIKYTNNGKPLMSNYSFYYNISHSDDMVICGTCELPIGVDIQKKKNVNLDTKKVFCSKNELDYVTDINSFYTLYSLKEAFLKMQGLTINDIKNICIVKNNHIDLGNDCDFELINDENYVASICYMKQ